MIKRRFWIPIASAVMAIVLLASALFFYKLLKLNLLVSEYMALIGAVLLLFVYVIGVLLFYGVRRKRSVMRRIRRIIALILAAVLTFGCIYGFVMLTSIEKTMNTIVAKPEENDRAIVGVYVKKDDPASALGDMADYTYAVLGELGNEKINSNYAIAKINEQLNAEVAVISYPGITDAAIALRDGEVQALAVNKSFLSLLDETESLKGYADEMKLIDEIRVPNTATLENTPIIIGTAVPEPTPEPTPEPEA